MKDLRVVIVTHPHLDHFGSAAALSKESGAQIWTSRDTGLWLQNFEKECFEEEAFTVKSLELASVPSDLIGYSTRFFRFMKQYAQRVVASRYLQEGESVDLGSHYFRVEHVPGHTPWCIMLYNAEKRIAFTGDFLLKDISSNPLIQRPWMVPDGYKSLKAYKSSLQRVADMNLELALPGHGELISNPNERIRDLLGFMNIRAFQIAAILRKKDDFTVFDVVKELFHDLPLDQLFLAVSEVFAHLEVLEDEGIVGRSQDYPPRFTIL
jgi:glyoxylase-like metal-dependent hydrolase (beta-lactamase superfamily II)